jgi:urea transporter
MKVLGQQVLPDIAPEEAPLWRQMLRGFSQCAFQANEATAACFILAVFLYNWQMGVFYVVSVIVATLVARFMGANPVLLGLGLFGFNSGLMGLALGNFFVVSALHWVWVPVLAAVVAALAVVMSRYLSFPFLAAPFILTFWIVWPFAAQLGLEPVNFGAFENEQVNFLRSTVVALGSTLFAGSLTTGILFLLGVLVSEWRHAVAALIGAILAASIAAYVGTAGGAINSGFIAFNAVLASIAAFALIAPDLRLVILAAFLSTWIFSIFNRYWPEPALAAGFVLGIWSILALAHINTWFRQDPE